MVETIKQTALFQVILGSVDTFTSFLNVQLKDRGWSISELARRANVSQSLASDVVNGKLAPSERFCLRAARALGLPGESMLRLAGYLPPLLQAQADEGEFLHAYRTLSPEERAIIKRAISGLVRNQPAQERERGPPREEERKMLPHRGDVVEGNVAPLDVGDPIRDQLDDYVSVKRPPEEFIYRLAALLRLVGEGLELYFGGEDEQPPTDRIDDIRDVPTNPERIEVLTTRDRD